MTKRDETSRPRGLRRPGRFQVAAPGSPPGVEPHELPAVAALRAEVRVTCIDFAPGHPLAIEDVLQPSQRPKVDDYEEQGDHQARLCIMTRMVQLRGGQLHADQVSILLGRKTVLTFHEAAADIWSPIRQRIHTAGSRLRGSDASFLVYALIDTSSTTPSPSSSSSATASGSSRISCSRPPGARRYGTSIG
jgi:hypothetical protein